MYRLLTRLVKETRLTVSDFTHGATVHAWFTCFAYASMLQPALHAVDDSYHDDTKPNCLNGQPSTSTFGMILSWGPLALAASPPPQLILSGSVIHARNITPITRTGHEYSELPAITVRGVDNLELNAVKFARPNSASDQGAAIDTKGLVENHGHGKSDAVCATG